MQYPICDSDCTINVFYIETQVLLKKEKNKNKNVSVVDRANKNVSVFN